jgi:hypothetical protein
MGNNKRPNITQERETVKYMKFIYTGEETKFITRLLKYITEKFAFETNNFVRKLLQNKSLTYSNKN